MKRRFVVALVLALTLVLGLAAPTLGAAKPPKSAASPACTYTVWNRVEGPNSGSGYGASLNVSLFASEDLYTGQFCYYLYSAVNYSEPNSVCDTFTAVLAKGQGTIVASKYVTPYCGSSGTVDSPWYHANYWDNCWHAWGDINSNFVARTNCFANG